MVLAQSGLTTGWGKHVKNNAYFGMQGKVQKTDPGNFALFEVVEGKRLRVKPAIRAYRDYADSADDYGRFLSETPRFRRAFRDQDDPIRFAETVSSIGSVNNPQNAEILTRMIKSYALDEFDR
jgi:type VI secretion system secreted protein VgrG